jgi:ribosome-interacting GTPase 1
MPANLTPQYIKLRSELEKSKDIDEKIELLQEMIAIIPKHKGTNKMIGGLRSKLATFRKEVLNKPSKHKAYNPYSIVRQGAGQVVVIGFPNVGKSSLVAKLTKVHTAVAPYPFTTEKPIVGMMPFENINIQLIDTPPITEDSFEPSLIDLIRRADLIFLLVDAGEDEALDHIEFIKNRLEQAKLKLTMMDIGEDEETEFIHKKAMIVANKTDLEGSQDRIDTLNELYLQEIPVFGLSLELDAEFDSFKRMVFDVLHIIRVYTKPVGKKPDFNDPVILYRGSTVVEAAEEIHRDFAENLKFAKIWGGEYSGQRVSRDHPLEDGNILEFHVPD